jgi:Carboxypeptidase regulatory-like domain
MRQVAFVIALLSAASCGGDGGPADAPGGEFPISPTPLRPAWTLSGTVSETFPTGSTRIAGATVTAVAGLDADGRSTTSDGSGAFRLAGLPPGNYTIRARAADYVESTQPLTLAGNQTLAVHLDPAFQMVTTTREDSITASRSCAGPWDYGESSCLVQYAFDAHHDGTLTAELVWTDREVGFFTMLYRADGGQPVGGAIDGRVDESGRRVIYDVSAHTQYLIQVNAYASIAAPRVTPYTVTLTHPN